MNLASPCIQAVDTPNMVGNRKKKSPASATSSGVQSPRQSHPSIDTGFNTNSGAASGPTWPESSTRSEASAPEGQAKGGKPAKRRRNRNRKRRSRRQSFLAPEEPQFTSTTVPPPDTAAVTNLVGERPKPYNLGSNLSNTSLESEALLDHRYVGVVLAETD